MKQIIFLILGFYSMCATVSADEQYLLRVDEVGYTKSIESSPKETVSHSIEVVSRLNETFRSKVQTGGYTRTMSGKLSYEDGEFTVKIHYAQTFDDGTRVLGKPVLGRTEFKSSKTRVAVGKSVLLGGFETGGGGTIFVPQTKTKAKNNFIPYLSKVIDKFDKKEEAVTVRLTKNKTKKHLILYLSEYEPAPE